MSHIEVYMVEASPDDLVVIIFTIETSFLRSSQHLSATFTNEFADYYIYGFVVL